MPLLPFRPQLVYQYVDARSKKKKDPETGKVTGGKIAAHREIELLSHAYTKAVEWGYIDRHLSRPKSACRVKLPEIGTLRTGRSWKPSPFPAPARRDLSQ
jgi:hypothetical protein